MLKEKVLIREVGLRDGLQLLNKFCPTDIKIKWLEQQYKLGFKEIEITSFVSEKIMPQFKDSKIILEKANKMICFKPFVLVPNLKGANIALENYAKNINFVISASESHNLANVNSSVLNSLSGLKSFLTKLKETNIREKIFVSVTIATSFGCSIEGDIDTSEVLKIFEKLVEFSVDEIGIADTVGYGNPKSVKKLIKEIKSIDGKIPLVGHFHDTRGMGMLNILSALDEGIRKFDTSVQGLGGCPFAPGASGNVVTEDCVFFLEEIGFDTGIDLKGILELSKKIQLWLPDERFFGKFSLSGLPKKKIYKNL